MERPRVGRDGHGSRAAARGGHDRARQDAHGRVRVRRLGPQRADGRAVESVGHGTPSRRRRLVERLRGGGCRRTCAGRDRLGHRRLDPHPGSAVRHDRAQADLWPRQPARRRAAVADARSDRSRLRAASTTRSPARRAGRARRRRSHDAPRPAFRGRAVLGAQPSHRSTCVAPHRRDGVRSVSCLSRRTGRTGARCDHRDAAAARRGRGGAPHAARLRRARARERHDHRGRGLRVPPRLYRGSGAADRPVGALAHDQRQGDQRRRLRRRARDASRGLRGNSSR